MRPSSGRPLQLSAAELAHRRQRARELRQADLRAADRSAGQQRRGGGTPRRSQHDGDLLRQRARDLLRRDTELVLARARRAVAHNRRVRDLEAVINKTA